MSCKEFSERTAKRLLRDSHLLAITDNQKTSSVSQCRRCFLIYVRRLRRKGQKDIQMCLAASLQLLSDTLAL